MTKRVILPAEAAWEMLIRGRDAMIDRIEDDDIDLSTDDASACFAAMRDASPNAGKVTEAELETMAVAYEACPSFEVTEGIRAALSALGLEVE